MDLLIEHSLALRGRPVVQRGVTPLTVVEAFDELGDLVSRRGSILPSPSIDKLLLQRREEALGDRVVPARALAAHAGCDPVLVQYGAVVTTGVLASSVRVMH